MGFGDSPERRRAFTQALRDNGMTLTLVEGFSVTPSNNAADIALRSGSSCSIQYNAIRQL
jgi:hypothetical protein